MTIYRYSIIDDTDPALVWTGNWQQVDGSVINPRVPHYNGTVHVSNDPTATVSYKFRGVGLNVFGTLDAPVINGYPNATFSVSPNVISSIRLNQTGYMPSIAEGRIATTHLKLFPSGRIEMGDYNMTITTDGVRIGGPAFYLDFLAVLIPEEEPAQGEHSLSIVDDSDEKWNWNLWEGRWSTANRPSEYGYTSHLTTTAGGEVSLQFEGTEITVYGALAYNYTTTQPIGTFQVDQDQNRTVMPTDLPNFTVLNSNGPTGMRHQKLFVAEGLAPGVHTLSLSVPPFQTSTPSIKFTPWALDYAIYGPITGSSSPSPSMPAPAPIGAIVGGVVGGIALLAVIGVILFWRWKRRRNSSLFEHEAEAKGGISTTTPLPPPPTLLPSNGAGSSKTLLAGRFLSTHKPGKSNGQQPHRAGEGVSPITDDIMSDSHISRSHSGMYGAESSLAGDERASRLLAESQNVGTSRPRREVDGGVRLVDTPSDVEEKTEILPPSYARYA